MQVKQKSNVEKVLQAKKMTLERLRSFEGFEQITDSEGEEFIETMEQLCGIIARHVIVKEREL